MGTLVTSNGGPVSITGTGGGTGDFGSNLGVAAFAGAEISAGGTGTVTVQGTGGVSGGIFNVGIYLYGAQLTSGGGAVSITGTGGLHGSGDCYGVEVWADTAITAGGMGTVTILGIGGGGTEGGNCGVLVGETITSGGGAVSITGTGGSGSGNNVGVYLFSRGTITAGGTGGVSVTGTGGAGASGNNHGVSLDTYGPTITSNNGAVSVTGIAGDDGGAGAESYGVDVQDNSSIASGGTNNLTVTTDSLNIGPSATLKAGAAGGQTLTIATRTGAPINLGADDLTAGNFSLGLSGDELARLSAGTLQIGDANTGTVTVGSALTAANLTGITSLVRIGTAGRPIVLSADAATANNADLTFAGNVTVSGTPSLNTGSGATTFGGTVDGDGTAGRTLTTATTGATTFAGAVGGTAPLAALDITTGALAVAAVATTAGLSVANSGAGTISGVLSNTGGLTKAGAGTLTLSAANTYTGTTQVNAGTLRAGAADAFSADSAVTLANVAAAVLDLNGNNNTVASLSGGGASGGNVTLGTGTLATGGNNNPTTYAGAISGTGGLTKTGTDAFTLTGTNTYTGATAVLDGALLVNGTNAGAVTVAAGAALGGTGAIAGPVTANASGLVAPGTGTGELSTGTYNQAGTLAIELNGTAPGTEYDRLGVTGTITLAGPLAVTLGYAPLPGDEYVIVANDGTDTVGGTFDGLPEGAVLAVGTERFQISYAGGDGNDVVLRLYTAVSAAVSPASVTEGGAGGLVYTFTRTGGLTGSLTVSFLIGGSATFGADYTQSGAITFTATGGTVAFAAGVSTVTVTLSPVNDQLVEGDETAVLTVLDGAGYADGSQPAVTGTIADNDTATLSLTPVASAAEAGGPVTVAVTLTTSDGAGGTAILAPGVTLTAQVVDLLNGSATSGTDYTAFGVPSVSFNPGSENGATQTVTLTSIDDNLCEPNETINLRLQNLSPSLSGDASLGNVNGVITVVSDDPPPVVSLSVAGSPFGEDGGQATVTATLSTPSALDTTVTLGFAGTATFGSDYATAATSVVIPAGQLSARVVLTGILDMEEEPDETVVVTVAGVANGTAGPGATATLVDETDSAAGPPVTVTRLAVGQGSGGRVNVYDAAGALMRNFVPFVGWTGEVRVATGDVTGDGTEDIIVGAGPGVFGHVKVFDGQTGAEVRSFYAFEGFNGGVKVAAGDIDGDGYADLIVGASVGGHVKVFSGRDNALLRSFYSFEGFDGDVSVAGGDIDGDGYADIVVASGAGTAPHVKAFSGRDNTLLRSFLVLSPNFPGVSLAAGDMNGDGHADIVVGSSSQPVVRVYDGRTGDPIADLNAFSQFQGGVRVGTSDADGDGLADMFVGIGPGGPGGHVKAFKGTTHAELASFYTFEPAYLGGVYIG